MNDTPDVIYLVEAGENDIEWVETLPLGIGGIKYICADDFEAILDCFSDQMQTIYPADIFDGSSGDEGPRIVSAVRDGVAKMKGWRNA